MDDSKFRDTVLAPRYGRVEGRVNLERVELDPPLAFAAGFAFDVVGGRVRPRPVATPKRAACAVPTPVGHFDPATANQSPHGAQE
jgi:hypothetical protein